MISLSTYSMSVSSATLGYGFHATDIPLRLKCVETTEN
jgi:hypothetical protein